MFARSTIKAERALAVYEGKGVAYGFNPDSLWNVGEVSHTLLKTLLAEKQPLVMMDALEDDRLRQQMSAILMAARSILFLPLANPAGHFAGFLYLDCSTEKGTFRPADLAQARAFVDRQFLPQLHQAAPEAASPPLDWARLLNLQWLVDQS